MGSVRSARRIQPGERFGRPVRVGISLLGGPPPGPVIGLRRAHFLRGGAPRPAPVRPGRVRGRRWHGGSAPAPRALQRYPPRPDFAELPPGPRAVSSRLPSLRGGTGPPASGACVARGGLSSVRLRTRRAARAAHYCDACALAYAREGQRGNFDLSVQESTRRAGIDSRSGIDLI